MLIIRAPQLAALASAARARFGRSMRRHVRASFPDIAGTFDDVHLDRQIAGALEEADRYGLCSQRQACQFLNLCAVYGWGFLKEPEHQWMIADYLENRAILDADGRITLLVDECISRLRVEEANHSLAERFFPVLDANDDADDLDEDPANVPLLDEA